MPNLLANDRMSAALRARIQESLRTDARARVGGQSHGVSRPLRILGAFALVLLCGFLWNSYRQSRVEFRREKAQVLKRLELETQALSQELRRKTAFLDELLEQAQAQYPGDFVDPLVRDVTKLGELLERPLVYVRGAIHEFQTKRERRSTFPEGGPDALIRCLIEPPPSTSESDLLRHLGHVYQPATFRGRFVNMEPAYRAFDFIDSDFKTQLESTQAARNLTALSRKLDAAKLREAASAAKAELFVYVLDEPKVKGVPSDLDGEAEHDLRFSIVDLSTQKTLVRVRRRVDPEWISEKSRIAYSRELNSCRLAWELRRDWREPELITQ